MKKYECYQDLLNDRDLPEVILKDILSIYDKEEEEFKQGVFSEYMDGNIYRIETLNDCDFVKGFNINDQQPFIVSITKVQATFDIAHWLPDKSGAVFCAITGNNGGDLFYVPAKFVEQVPSMLIALVIGDYSG